MYYNATQSLSSPLFPLFILNKFKDSVPAHGLQVGTDPLLRVYVCLISRSGKYSHILST